MLKIKVILCPVDFSEFSARAYRYALSLAEHYGAQVVVQHVAELWRYPSAGFAASAALYDEFCQSVCENGKEQLQKFVKSNTPGAFHPDLAVHEGIAPDSILSFAQALKADGIVMGTHGQRGFDRLMLGSVTERVMRNASCPVLVVRNPSRDLMATDKDGRHVHHLRQILFCTDFSENSERALNYAVSAAEEYDAELTLLHVLEEATGPANTEKAITAATDQLDKLISPEARKTLRIKLAVRSGKPYRQIIQFAEDGQSDMVAMGVRGRGALDLAVFGSTTYRVMQLGPCPVLAVHL